MFDVIVIGKGMMGAAAARHLALTGPKVLLIGPDEPTDRKSHSGVFASHYDQGRISRRLDTDPVWANLAARSMERYDEIAEQGGIAFFHKAGALLAGNEDYVARVAQTGNETGVTFQSLSPDELAQRFPCFTFPDGTSGLFEPGGGYVNPRSLVDAQTQAAGFAGATVIRKEVAKITEAADHVSVQSADGTTYRADKAIVAAGAFANMLLPQEIALNINPRTVVLFELDTSEVTRLADMPSMIHEPENDGDGPYLLPPIQYPDGKTYLKIGGDHADRFLQGSAEITQWFRKDGTEKGLDYLIGTLMSLMPKLQPVAITTAPCVTTLTREGYPVIAPQSDRIIALTAGNGAAAKSSDEIGRLGAVLAQTGSLGSEPYPDVFGAPKRD
ncbi:MAG: NAD(P)/FAD-dependent oxidoreductase [Marinosulfonomonas sp.]